MPKKKTLLVYGIGYIASYFFPLPVIFVYRMLGKTEALEGLREFYMSFITSSTCFCMLTLDALLLVPALVRFIGRFHEDFNSENLHREPVKSFLENESAIVTAFSYVIFAGSLLVFYGAWLGTVV